MPNCERCRSKKPSEEAEETGFGEFEVHPMPFEPVRYVDEASAAGRSTSHGRVLVG
jgi:hypothetical protein